MRKALLLIMLGCLAVSALGATMYARISAPVRAGTGLSADTLGRLRQGEAVETAAREGRYYRVRYQGKAGYVYYNKLADQKPEDVSSLLSSGPGTEGIELSELEAGGALRGLSPMAQNYVEASDVPEWAVQAVEDMQGRAVSAQTLEQFQRAGGLGEYGEGGAP